MKIREEAVEEQIQWILSYVQRVIADVQKENILEDLEVGVLEYETIGKFLTDIKKKFREEEEEEEETVKVAKLRRLE